MSFLMTPDNIALVLAGMALAVAFVAFVLAARARQSARDVQVAVSSLSALGRSGRSTPERNGPIRSDVDDLWERVKQIEWRLDDSRFPASRTDSHRWGAEDSREARRLGLYKDPAPTEPDFPANPTPDSASALPPEAASSIDPPAQPVAPEPAPRAPSGDAVEFDGEVLSLSRSLNALGLLERGGSGDAALLYLNPEVEVDHIVREKWASLFAFNGGRSYVRYRTVHPARVRWDEGTQTGVPVSPGVAEVIQ